MTITPGTPIMTSSEIALKTHGQRVFEYGLRISKMPLPTMIVVRTPKTAKFFGFGPVAIAPMTTQHAVNRNAATIAATKANARCTALPEPR